MSFMWKCAVVATTIISILAMSKAAKVQRELDVFVTPVAL